MGHEEHRPGPREPLRGLTGAGPSKVGVSRAMRARDVSRDGVEPAPDRPDAQSEGGAGSGGSSPLDS